MISRKRNGRSVADFGASQGVRQQGTESALTSTLKPAARNARTHSQKQIRQIANSIRQFGFINPIIVDDHNRIIAGHGRYEAAKLLDMREVEIIRVSHLTEEEIRAYMLADNKLAENAGWDAELLRIELGELGALL